MPLLLFVVIVVTFAAAVVVLPNTTAVNNNIFLKGIHTLDIFNVDISPTYFTLENVNVSGMFF